VLLKDEAVVEEDEGWPELTEEQKQELFAQARIKINLLNHQIYERVIDIGFALSAYKLTCGSDYRREVEELRTRIHSRVEARCRTRNEQPYITREYYQFLLNRILSILSDRPISSAKTESLVRTVIKDWDGGLELRRGSTSRAIFLLFEELFEILEQRLRCVAKVLVAKRRDIPVLDRERELSIIRSFRSRIAGLDEAARELGPQILTVFREIMTISRKQQDHALEDRQFRLRFQQDYYRPD